MLEKSAPLDAATYKLNSYTLETPSMARRGRFEPFGKDGVSFLDFLDIINPLQHIPLVSTLYRKITGDEIDPASRLAGSALYGGPIGAVSSLIEVIVEFNTGKTIGEHALETTSRGNTKLKDTPHMAERKEVENPLATSSPVRQFLPSKGALVGLRSDIHGVGLNNPFLAKQRADQPPSSTALLEIIEGLINREEKMKLNGKVQNRHATRAYNGASYLE